MHDREMEVDTVVSSLVGAPLAERLRLELAAPVRLDVFPGRTGTVEGLGALAAATPLLRLAVHADGREASEVSRQPLDRLPCVVLRRVGPGRLRFLGIPTGTLFAALVEDLVDLSRGRSRLPDELRSRLAALPHPVHLRVFASPTCPHGLRVSRLAHQAAIDGPLVSADVVDATAFPDLVQSYHVAVVPKLVVGGTELLGYLRDDDVVRVIERAGHPRPSVAASGRWTP